MLRWRLIPNNYSRWERCCYSKAVLLRLCSLASAIQQLKKGCSSARYEWGTPLVLNKMPLFCCTMLCHEQKQVILVLKGLPAAYSRWVVLFMGGNLPRFHLCNYPGTGGRCMQRAPAMSSLRLSWSSLFSTSYFSRRAPSRRTRESLSISHPPWIVSISMVIF